MQHNRFTAETSKHYLEFKGNILLQFKKVIGWGLTSKPTKRVLLRCTYEFDIQAMYIENYLPQNGSALLIIKWRHDSPAWNVTAFRSVAMIIGISL